MLDYLDNKCSLEEAVEIIKRDARHLQSDKSHGLKENPMLRGLIKKNMIITKKEF